MSLDPTSSRSYVTEGELTWQRVISTDTFAARDLEAYPPPPPSHRRQSVNMPKYESFVPESRYSSASALETSHSSSKSTSPQISRANSDVSLYAPIRRRSLIQTPGVATRAPSVSEPARRSSTKLESRKRHSRTASFDPGPETISVLPRISDCGEERAVTPNDIEYRQLGTMKFGSLRITNGAPSPCSDRKGGTDDSGKKLELKNGSNSSVDAGPKERTTDLNIVQPRPISVSISPVAATFLKLESGDFDQSNVASKHEAEKLKALHASFNFGSFSFTEPASGPTKLQTTSKHTAAEDTLLGEDVSSSPLEYEGVGLRDMVSTRRRVRHRGSETASKTRVITRPDSGFISSPVSETSSKQYSKTDSGYSSNVSLRSLRNSKISMDKELPSRPDESSGALVPNQSHPSTSFPGDSRLSLSQHVSLEREFTSAPLNQEVPPPAPPPKNDRLVAPVAPSAVTKSASIPLLNRSATSAKAQETARRPSFLSTSGIRVSEPESPNSIQLSPAHANVSQPTTIDQPTVQKPGPLKRLLSVASRKGSRRGPRDRSFRDSDTASTLKESTASTISRTKSSRDRREGESGLLGMGSSNAGEYSHISPRQTAPTQSKSSAGATVRRHSSLQSIHAAIVNAAASVLPSRRFHEKSGSSSVEETDNEEDREEEAEGNERWSKNSSSGSDVAPSEDYTRDSLMRNGFDPSFMAMTSARDAYFSPAPSRTPSRGSSTGAYRTGRVASRSVDVRTSEVQAMSRTGSLASLHTYSSYHTNIREHPHMSAEHPLRRTRSVAQLRVPAPLRPQSTRSGLHRSQSQTHYPRPSREPTYSYPPTTASSRSSFNSTRSRLETHYRYQQRSINLRKAEGSASLNKSEKFNFLPRGPGSLHSRTGSLSSQASSAGLYAPSINAHPYSGQYEQAPRRPSSANPFPDMQRQGPALRHHASYEMQPSKLKAQPSREFRRQSPNLWTSTHYEQLQMQYGGTAFDPRVVGYLPYVPRAAHSRDRSLTSQGSGAPYRVLHSYYSPAYRHVPIWG